MTENIAKPPVASREEWLKARLELLQEEKDLTHHKDRVNAKRKRLPMVKVEKEYVFDTPDGKKSLLDLFEGRRQLVVYHFMFDPSWDKGCPGCTAFADTISPVNMQELPDRDTTFVMISRAPLEKLQKYEKERGWTWTWVSSFGSDFNYDFGATQDKSRPETMEYNYKPTDAEGEEHGTSVFFRDGDEVYHTYSAFARSTEGTGDSYGLLDLTPYGRQEDFEDAPEGFPQKPTYG